MSEPMSNHEIEDVLSSIRRLVSEDLRPAPRQKDLVDLVAPPVAEQKTTGKLLLTPAFRVVETPADDGNGADQPLPLRLQTRAPDADRASPASFGDAVDLASPHADDTTPQDADWARDSDPQDWAPPRLGAAASQPPAVTAVEDVVSKLGAAVSAHDEEWESPVGDVDALSSAGWSQPVWDKPADVLQGSVEPPPEPGLAFVHRARTPEPQREDFIETASDAFAQDEGDVMDWEDPEPEETRPNQPRIVTPPREPAQDWADAAEAAVMEDLARNVEQETSGLFEQGDGSMTFDEEVLRDLVRDIIREELSGALGERITRNVRKLVRAEIARALAVREFE